ncbi:DUF5686 and carboxypeptidase regulatory-like domain-containing protein [Flavobacterium celericrescens]|uniref:Carboxypeptidase-like regulatory domain-containing protein n=1 Tax=Flavobacterium celericrescens TaxID=2709780 RepID=A0ABX0IE54_9FLAO|nr:DUF5686 and carboxypeptidase regulatory-like domain-containing protein [Flavobacterium celericrescens]NHM04603.1 carboxypeptidase-like regulatory domain-containing protein [Flavobacterium celericrescens]
MNKIVLAFSIFFSVLSFSQIKGTVKDVNGNPLPYVNIYIENTYINTTTNELGNYELNYFEKKNVPLIFQYLGYKTEKHVLNITQYPYQFDNVLEEEKFQLNEVVIDQSINPADEIIRKSIASRKKNAARTDKFEADFYSRGIFRAKDIPKKFMGMEIGDFEGNLDSTRSGIIYQSETVSKIKFEKPDNLKEEIIASKIAGNDNGFSYNTALNTNYDFYENYVDLGINMVSPIANNAFNYYKFKLESSFLDDKNQLINKIKVTPKRDKEPVFEGYIYIVEDSWAIYGIDLDIKGYRMQQPILENMKLTQNFSYNESTKIWAKNIQSLEFSAGIFGMKFTGKFTHVFSNYIFKDAFEKKTFGKEIVTFADNANKKEESFWNEFRPVPLTTEEATNYVKKDSIQTVRKSEIYLDSIDAKGNKFKIHKLITGYTYKKTFKKWSFNYQGMTNLSSLSFNTVQGWNLDSGFSFRKWDEETGKYTYISSTFNYGFAEDRVRVNGRYYHRFNNKNNAYIAIAGGSSINQFNSNEPISNIVNSVSTLFFKNNFMKLYNKEFAEISYGREVTNGIYVSGKMLYENRHALFNNTDYTFIKNDDAYFSNDPLQPFNYTSTPFEKHHIMKASIGTRIRFGQKYISRPDGKINIQNDDYPILSFNYEKAFGATNNDYHYDLISASVDYNKTIGNKGDFGLRFKAGKFFNAENISFIDYKHFNGNQTHVNLLNNSLNSFNLLPYYSHSTNDAYFETHIEHNFKGYIMNKIPLLNKLQWNLIGGFHQINIPDRKPYQEVTVGFDNIGWGKLRFLRIDYVRSYQNGFQGDGIMFGVKF